MVKNPFTTSIYRYFFEALDELSIEELNDLKETIKLVNL